MNSFVSKLLSNSLGEARNKLDETLRGLINNKIDLLRIRIAAELAEEFGGLLEGNVTRMGRTKLVKVRIRNGKVQRRKKLSAVKGYTIRGGKLTRMSPIERRHRKMAAKRSRFKRRAKLRQSLRKRRISDRKRTALGL